MRACARCGIVLLVAFVLFVGYTGGVRVLAAQKVLPADARIQRLLDLHLVLQQPQLTLERLGSPSAGSETNNWIRAYAWTRGAWSRVLDLRKEIGHVWFGLRTSRADASPWGIQRDNWLFTSLRDAYLDDKLIDLSFQPLAKMSGSDGINMLLAAAGFSGEVAAMKVQMKDPVGDVSLRVVCRQHGFDQVMEYAGKPLTRGDAVVLAWRLLAERTNSD